jgi:hypothetical protein
MGSTDFNGWQPDYTSAGLVRWTRPPNFLAVSPVR